MDLIRAQPVAQLAQAVDLPPGRSVGYVTDSEAEGEQECLRVRPRLL